MYDLWSEARVARALAGLSAAMSGPTTTSGPIPGITSAPTPARSPKAPPTPRPAIPTAAAASGALVPSTAPVTSASCRSGNSTAISGSTKPLARSSSTTAFACGAVFAMPCTTGFMVSPCTALFARATPAARETQSDRSYALRSSTRKTRQFCAHPTVPALPAPRHEACCSGALMHTGAAR